MSPRSRPAVVNRMNARPANRTLYSDSSLLKYGTSECCRNESWLASTDAYDIAPGVVTPIIDGGTRKMRAISSTAKWRDSMNCDSFGSTPVFWNVAPPKRMPGRCERRRPLWPSSNASTRFLACSRDRLPGNWMMPDVDEPCPKNRAANSSSARDRPRFSLTRSMRDLPRNSPGRVRSLMWIMSTSSMRSLALCT